MEQVRDATLQQIAEKALTHSVVRLDVKRETSLVELRPQFDISEIKTSSGSGFFIQQQLIVTNLHVVAGAASVTAKLSGTGHTFQIEGITAFDIENDLALLKVASEGSPLTFGDSDSVRKGNLVCAIGYPKGIGKIADGTIHGIKRSKNLIQMKIGTATGSSGSPILNKRGHVIGIHASSDNSHSYAIPINTLKDLMKETGEPEAFKAFQEREFVRAYVHAETGDDKQKQREYKAAIAHYDFAIELDPNIAKAYTGRAAAKVELWALGRAIEDMRIARRLKRVRFSFSNFGEYCAWRRKGLWIVGGHLLIKLLKSILGKSGWFRLRGIGKFEIAKSEADRGDRAKAIALYQEVIDDWTEIINLKPKKANTYNTRGWTKYLLGQLKSEQGNAGDAQRLYQAAVSDSDEALRLQAKGAKFRSAFYHTRGAAKAALGDYNGAIEDFSECIRLNPKKALYHHDRGKAKDALGQHKAAKVDFAKAKELDPDIGK